jgi:Flp pilus assembly pilin Flp
MESFESFFPVGTRNDVKVRVQPATLGADPFISFEYFFTKGGERTMINKVINRAKIALRRMKSKKGQTLVEYALILAFISVVAISVLIALGNQVKGVFTTISSQLAYAGSSH